MLIARDIELEIGGRTLVRGGSFTVGATEKVALVGRNGAGKSSLLAYLLGDPPHQLLGSGAVQRDGTIGYLPQIPLPEGLGVDASVLSHVLSARGLDVLDEQLQAARRTLEQDPSPRHVERFSALEERYRLAGGYEIEGRLARLAEGLGLHQDLLLEDLAALSGGQRRRVDLVRVLFAEPDLMILDEPTNHLDRAAKVWLMEELASRPGALLVVSHDLALLDRAIDKVVALAGHELREFKGNYGAYRRQLDADVAASEKAAHLESARVTKMRAQADAWRHSSAAQARKAKILDRRVERLESNRTSVLERERAVTFALPDPVRAGRVVLEVAHLGVAYGGHRVLHDVDLAVERGDRVVVIGRNGAGKSSLLRCLAGVQAPSRGSVQAGYRVEVGYFAQEHEQVDLALGALENLDDSVLVAEADRRSLLASFGLSGPTALQRAGSLSGGERARLSLAMLAASPANLLVLDEPTNNLDPPSVAAIGAMLGAWKGTIVAVSHDASFVEALAPTHALHLPAERSGFWRDDYLEEVEVR